MTQVRSEPKHTELVRVRLLPSCRLVVRGHWEGGQCSRSSERAGQPCRNFGVDSGGKEHHKCQQARQGAEVATDE